MSVTPLQALQAASQPSAPGRTDAIRLPLLVAGAGGLLGGEVLNRLIGAGGHATVHVLVREAFQPALRGVQPLQLPPDVAGEPDFPHWPRVPAAVGVVMFEPPRAFHERERMLWTPTPPQLPALARWMHACGVRTLAVVLPHARGRLPDALKHGLASLDEQALVAMGFERLLILRSAQGPVPAGARAGLLPRLADWMLDIFKYMVPPAEQPVRAAKLAEVVEAALQEAPAGTHVLPPELLAQAAQGAPRDVLGDWFRSRRSRESRPGDTVPA